MAETRTDAVADDAGPVLPDIGTQQITTIPTLDGSPVVPRSVATDPGDDNRDTAALGAGAAASQEGAPTPMEIEEQAGGAGTDNEEAVWEARYSIKNFTGAIVVRAALSLAWVALAVYTWGGSGTEAIVPVTVIAGVVVLLLWVALAAKMVRFLYGHYYRLTTRRLFVSSGMLRRRRDQMELLRVKDVSTQQTWLERWLSIGTVVVIPNDKGMPIFSIGGIDDPKGVMDLIWDHARRERDTRSTKVEPV